MEKRLLMVAYQFPPEGGSSGVLRNLKYSKYLPPHGWVPHVLTAKEWTYEVRDPGLLSDIPKEVVVHRAFALSNSRHLSIKGRHLAFLGVPDPYVSWIPFGVAKGLRVIRSEGIMALYSTSPPPSAHMIAYFLAKLTGLPWIADFRDPWIEEGIHPRPGSFRYKVEAALERAVVGRANRIILTTPLLRQEFLSRYSDLDEHKARVIYNGYDEGDFHGIDEIPRGERFELIHAGLITPDFRNPFPFLETIANLIRNRILPKEEVKVTFLGGGDYVQSSDFVEKVRREGLSGVVEVIRRVPHRESLERMRRAAVLLLIQASEDTRSLIPAKAFEYLRIGNPILALTLAGATGELIQETGQGEAVDPNDHLMLERAVTSLYGMWRKGTEDGVPFRPSILRYERSSLTHELALILDEMLVSPK